MNMHIVRSVSKIFVFQITEVLKKGVGWGWGGGGGGGGGWGGGWGWGGGGGGLIYKSAELELH